MLKIGYTKESIKLQIRDEIKENICHNLQILDENYGEERDIIKDLGGYVIIAEAIEDIAIIRNEVIRGTVPEDVEEIVCGDGQIYCSSLFILSSDYAVIVVAVKELTEMMLENLEE